MKFNRSLLGLGVMALAFAACSDDVEYTSAPAVDTPAAYFSSQEETIFDLEEDDDHVYFNVYRANAGAAEKVPVDITITSEDGTPVNAGLFTYTPEADFAEGEALARICVEFDVNNLKHSNSYYFNCKVAGNASPYFLTALTFDVSFTPWQLVDDCHIYDTSSLQVFGINDENIWEVTVQEHPLRPGFFRIYQPYRGLPKFGAYYNLPDNDPHYLYINATTPNEAYFSDAKGNPLVMYNTGIWCEGGNGFEETYGYLTLACTYSAYLNKEDIVAGSTTLSYSNFSSNAGELVVNEKTGTRKVKFNGQKLLTLLPDVGGGAWGADWELWLNGANENEDWSDLGMATYTDGFIEEYYKLDSEATYQVPIQQHNTREGVYRLIGAYGNTYCPFGAQESNNISFEIDCSDPNFVIIKDQLAMSDAYGDNYVVNAGYIYTNDFLQNTPAVSKEEVISQGLNDTFDAATGTIYINHPALLTFDTEGKGTVQLLWKDSKHRPGKVILPEQGAGGNSIAPKSERPTTKKYDSLVYRKRDLTRSFKVAK